MIKEKYQKQDQRSGLLDDEEKVKLGDDDRLPFIQGLFYSLFIQS